jgi:hypothetical protein
MEFPLSPRCLTDLAVFARVLALITIAGEIYSDAVLTSSLISPAAPDTASVAVSHAAKHG